MEELIRDKVPDIMRRKSLDPVFRIVTGDEYRQFLWEKLGHEMRELIATPENVEEYADVLEVLRALAASYGWPRDAVFEEMEAKSAARGGFWTGQVWKVDEDMRKLNTGYRDDPGFLC